MLELFVPASATKVSFLFPQPGQGRMSQMRNVLPLTASPIPQPELGQPNPLALAVPIVPGQVAQPDFGLTVLVCFGLQVLWCPCRPYYSFGSSPSAIGRSGLPAASVQ